MSKLIRLILCSLFIPCAAFANAQLFVEIGGTQSDTGRAVAVDPSDNYFIAGQFRQTVDFDPGPGIANLTAISGATYLASYDSDGNYRFAIQLGGTSGSSPTERALVVDSVGNVFITGWFTGVADFDPGPGTETLIATSANMFLASYDNNGGYRFAFNLTTDAPSTLQLGTALAIDNFDNVYLTGAFPGEMDFDPGAGVALLEAEGNTDAFLASYNNNGGYRFAIAFGGANGDQGNGVAVDSAGNAYVTGFFRDTADFDPTANDELLVSNGATDIFIASYDSSGAYRYAWGFGDTGDDRGLAIATTGAGVSYITGFFAGQVDFDPSASSTTLDALMASDLMLASYDSNGGFRFAFSLGNTNNNVLGRGLALDPLDNIMLTGEFRGSLDVDPSGASFVLGNTGTHALVGNYSSSGALLDAYIYEGLSGDAASSFGIAVNSQGLPVVAGIFDGDVDFDPSLGTQIETSSSAASAFLTTITLFKPLDLGENIPLLPLGFLLLLGSIIIAIYDHTRP